MTLRTFRRRRLCQTFPTRHPYQLNGWIDGEVQYQSPVQYAILDRQPLDGRVQVAMRDLEFGDLDGVLGVQQAELQLLAVCSALTHTIHVLQSEARATHMTLGALEETTSFIFVRAMR